MKDKNNFLKILDDIRQMADRLDYQEVINLAEAIKSHKRIFIGGAGRSLFMMQSLAMRLMQIGFTSFVIGETTTPSIQKGDLLIVGSGSGDTKTLIPMSQKAKQVGADLALITIYPESSLGQMADLILTLAAPTAKNPSSYSSQTLQPGSSLFAQGLLILGDSLVLELIQDQGIEAANKLLMSNHANLE